MSKPSCFVIMPFGKKKYRSKTALNDPPIDIDFNVVYESLIKPAIIAADMEPIRADEEKVGGIIHKPMFERIILSDYVVADITGANANVFYELGIRHAVKPYTTVSISANDSELPFDLGPVRNMHYDLSAGEDALKLVRETIATKLIEAKKDKNTDSPVYQLVDGIQFQNSVAHEKTDIFRDRVKYDEDLKDSLAEARNRPKTERLAAINEIVTSIAPENEVTGVLIDIMLSYRDIGEYQTMIDFIEKMPRHVQQTVMVQEQYGFALNRKKNRAKAEKVLKDLIEKNGASSETYGILGRVYKDQFTAAYESDNELAAAGFLENAIDAYRNGFEADWRDAYPGINLITLLELQGNKEEVTRVLPVVDYAVQQKLKKKLPDYWDYATLLELDIIRQDQASALKHLQRAVATIKADWMFDTTINNLSMIRHYRKKRQEPTDLVLSIITELEKQKKLFQNAGA